MISLVVLNFKGDLVYLHKAVEPARGNEQAFCLKCGFFIWMIRLKVRQGTNSLTLPQGLLAMLEMASSKRLGEVNKACLD